MKSIRFGMAVVLALVTILAFGAILQAQTKVTPSNIGSGGIAGPKVWVVLPSGAVQLADLQGLTIDTSGPVPILKATAATQSGSYMAKIVVPNPSVALPNTPIAGTVSFYRNGLLQAETEDYTISGNMVNAVGGAFLAGDILQAKYQY